MVIVPGLSYPQLAGGGAAAANPGCDWNHDGVMDHAISTTVRAFTWAGATGLWISLLLRPDTTAALDTMHGAV